MGSAQERSEAEAGPLRCAPQPGSFHSLLFRTAVLQGNGEGQALGTSSGGKKDSEVVAYKSLMLRDPDTGRDTCISQVSSPSWLLWCDSPCSSCPSCQRQHCNRLCTFHLPSSVASLKIPAYNGQSNLSCPTTPSFFMLGTSSGLKHNAGQDPDCCQAHVGAAHNPGHDKGASLLPTLFGCSLPPAWIPPRLLQLPAPQPSSKPKHLPAHPYVSHGSKRCQI